MFSNKSIELGDSSNCPGELYLSFTVPVTAIKAPLTNIALSKNAQQNLG